MSLSCTSIQKTQNTCPCQLELSQLVNGLMSMMKTMLNLTTLSCWFERGEEVTNLAIIQSYHPVQCYCTATLLDNEAVVHSVRQYLTSQNLGTITPHNLCNHINKVIIPALGLTGDKSSISERTSLSWLKKLGYLHKDVQKGIKKLDARQVAFTVRKYKSHRHIGMTAKVLACVSNAAGSQNNLP
ncbi:hypothetical protein P692DRAFT_20815159 [Suillus brevipes Sb2]|nr:hypothetical protein P692DRAFT_20815159 [Suillus brevipes Sb2]